MITTEGHGYDAERGGAWFAGETAEAVLLEMDARRRSRPTRPRRSPAARLLRPMPRPRRPRRRQLPRQRLPAVAHLRERTVDPIVLGALVEVTATL